jgi:MFS family permease
VIRNRERIVRQSIFHSPDLILHANFRHLYADILWFGVVAGSTASFLSVYAARLGATSFQIGLLTAGPALVNLIFSLPTGRWLERRPLIRATFRASLWHRMGYLALIPLPWLFATAGQVWSLLLTILLMSLPGTLLAIAFNAMFADVVPPDWRAHVVGRRQALLAISTTVATLACGQLLDRIAFPLNYQVVFGIGALGAILSSYHLGRIRALTPERRRKRVGRPLNDPARPGFLRWGDALRPYVGLRFLTRAGGKPLLRLDLLRGPFGPFLAVYFLFYTFQYVPIPLFPLFLVQELHLSDGTISLGNALFYATILPISMRLGPISARLGHHRVMLYGAMLYGLYPLFHGLATDATLYWVASFTGGSIWALTSSGLTNRLMDRVPEDDRPAHMALHNLVLNLGVLAGSTLGPLLGDWLGLRQALLISAALRLLGGILLGLWG